LEARIRFRNRIKVKGRIRTHPHQSDKPDPDPNSDTRQCDADPQHFYQLNVLPVPSFSLQTASEGSAGLTEAGGRQNLAGDAAARDSRVAQAVAASVLSQVPVDRTWKDTVLGIRIRRIRMLLGLSDTHPDPLVSGRSGSGSFPVKCTKIIVAKYNLIKKFLAKNEILDHQTYFYSFEPLNSNIKTIDKKNMKNRFFCILVKILVRIHIGIR
jgi:hypothetical protein